MKFKGLKAAILGVSLMSAGAATAETVTATLSSVKGESGTINVITNAGTNNEGAGIGALIWTNATWAPDAGPSTFWTFCIQATAGHNVGFVPYTFTLQTLQNTDDLGVNTSGAHNTGTAADKADAIARMFQYVNDNNDESVAALANASSMPLSATEAAALQLAVWEIVYDGKTGSASGTAAFTGGNFSVTGVSSLALTKAALYLANDNYTPALIATGFVGLQDQVGGDPALVPGIAPLPAPALATMALLGLNGAGVWYGKRRRQLKA